MTPVLDVTVLAGDGWCGVVRKGQTLSHIAKQHGVSVSTLRKMNRMGSSRVKAGQTLKVPVSANAA